MNKKLLITLFLGFLSLMLVVGMVAPYFQGSGVQSGGLSLAPQRGTPVMKVSGETVTAEDIELIKRGTPVLTLVQEGSLADDFKIVASERAVQNALLVSDARAHVNVSRQEVMDELDKLRGQLGITDNADYRNWLNGQGLADHELRSELEKQLLVNRRVEQIQAEVPEPTEAQARAYYDISPQLYQSDPRVRARMIVTSDRAQAENLRAQALAGADFAALATQFSEVGREQGGAVGALQGGELAPVGEAAFVAPVAAEVFSQGGAGLTTVIEDAGRYYLVKVEEVLPPALRPFEEVRDQVKEAVKTAMGNERIEQWFSGLRAEAQIEFLDPAYQYENPVVATVGGQPILYSELLNSVVSNPNFEQLLTQLPGGDSGSFVNSLFKPEFLSNLILQYAAPTIARNNNLTIPGSRAEVLGGLYSWASERVQVTDEEVRAAFEANRADYQTPGSASVSVLSFPSRAQAEAFIASYSRSPSNLIASAAASGGTVSELGVVSEQDPALPEGLSERIFGAALSPAGEGSLSVPVEAGGFALVAYVTELIPPSGGEFADVSEQVRESVLAERQNAEAEAFLERELEKIPVENNLEAVLAAQAERVGATQAAAPDFQAVPDTELGTELGTGAEPEATPAGTEITLEDTDLSAPSSPETAPAVP